jgi:hypothetical protein
MTQTKVSIGIGHSDILKVALVQFRKMDDPLLSLAFSVFNFKGVYALLIGSGISRSAGVPTGWEIIQDLIRKAAYLCGEDAPDGETWFWVDISTGAN